MHLMSGLSGDAIHKEGDEARSQASHKMLGPKGIDNHGGTLEAIYVDHQCYVMGYNDRLNKKKHVSKGANL